MMHHDRIYEICDFIHAVMNDQATIHCKIMIAVNFHIVDVGLAYWPDGYDANGRHPGILRSK